QNLGGEHGFLARLGLRHHGAATRAGDRMEVHGVSHRAGGIVLHMDFDGIAYADPEEGTGYLTIECPVFVGGSVCELAFYLNSFKVEAHCLRIADADR